MAEDDQWRPIPDFDGHTYDGKYEINRDGEVRSWKVWMGDKRPLPRPMRVTTRRDGARFIQLGLHGGTHRIEKLVALAFPSETETEKTGSGDVRA